MTEKQSNGTAGFLQSPPATRPYELADYVDGVGVFCGPLAPAHFAEHAHPELTVAVNLENASSLATWQTATGRQLTRLIREGHTSVIPGDQPHGAEWREEAELLHIYLAPGFLSGAAGDLVRSDGFEITEDHTAEDPLIRQLGLTLREELKRAAGPEPRPGPRSERPGTLRQGPRLPGRLYVESVANVLTVHLLHNYSANEKPPVEPHGGLSKRELGRAVDYVGDNLAEDLTLAAIARAVGLSPYHFARRFKESTGLSPHRYVTQQRVEQAKKLLLKGELSTSEVARRVGFYDQSHLNRYVKRLLGATPKQILQESKNIQKDGKILQD